MPPQRRCPTTSKSQHTSVSTSPRPKDCLEQSVRLEAEAIVIGAAGDGLVGRYSIGSVAADLLYSAPVPLALAPRGTRYSRTERVREVTCALGRRQGAELLLDYAVRASSAAATPLRLVSLVALDPIFGRLRSDTEAMRDVATAHARAILDTARAALPEGFPVTSTIVEGPTIESAVNKLEWHDGDLIMVGSSRLGRASPAVPGFDREQDAARPRGSDGRRSARSVRRRRPAVSPEEHRACAIIAAGMPAGQCRWSWWPGRITAGSWVPLQSPVSHHYGRLGGPHKPASIG